MGEIGAGIQLGPNAFCAFDALGIGERARARAVYTERILMKDAVDESEIVNMPLGDAFRRRFGNPYAVSHRADIHLSLLEGVKESGRVELATSTHVERIEQRNGHVIAIDSQGRSHRGAALIGCDGVKSVVREQFVGDPVRVTGHVVYRAVVDENNFPGEMKVNAPCLWAGPDCHVVHYPLRDGHQYNLVVTFHSHKHEEWGVTDGSREEVLEHFEGIGRKPRQLLDLPKSWRRWATADREPIARWSHGRVTLLGDAAHPMMQYLAQGACMAMEDAVCLADSVAKTDSLEAGLEIYRSRRVLRTTRVQLMSRAMGDHVYHPAGPHAALRNAIMSAKSQDDWFETLDWLYGGSGLD